MPACPCLSRSEFRKWRDISASLQHLQSPFSLNFGVDGHWHIQKNDLWAHATLRLFLPNSPTERLCLSTMFGSVSLKQGFWDGLIGCFSSERKVSVSIVILYITNRICELTKYLIKLTFMVLHLHFYAKIILEVYKWMDHL